MFLRTDSKICHFLKIDISVCLINLYVSYCSAQLIGNRGVFSLPPGEEYRDEETRAASDRVSSFALRYQPVIDLAAELNRFEEEDRSRYRRQPVFMTSQIGRYGRARKTDLFFYSETRDIDTDPVIKNRVAQEWLKSG